VACVRLHIHSCISSTRTDSLHVSHVSNVTSVSHIHKCTYWILDMAYTVEVTPTYQTSLVYIQPVASAVYILYVHVCMNTCICMYTCMYVCIRAYGSTVSTYASVVCRTSACVPGCATAIYIYVLFVHIDVYMHAIIVCIYVLRVHIDVYIHAGACTYL
jgi:hypothetical protein